jgi:excisionase family DNA binding protein
MPRPDYSTWLTKQQAAEAIGVSTKTVEKLADAKQLQQAMLRRPGKPSIAVYHPDDVARVRAERNPEAEPFVLPPEDSPSQNVENPSPTSRVPALAKSQNALGSFAAIAEMFRPPDRVRLAERLFLTLDEASELSGLPKAYLRSLMAEGKIGLKACGRWRIRRADLEKL